jgi:hypothetical protein
MVRNSWQIKYSEKRAFEQNSDCKYTTKHSELTHLNAEELKAHIKKLYSSILPLVLATYAYHAVFQ